MFLSFVSTLCFLRSVNCLINTNDFCSPFAITKYVSALPDVDFTGVLFGIVSKFSVENDTGGVDAINVFLPLTNKWLWTVFLNELDNENEQLTERAHRRLMDNSNTRVVANALPAFESPVDSFLKELHVIAQKKLQEGTHSTNRSALNDWIPFDTNQL